MFNLRDGRMMRNTYTASQWGLWYLFGADGRILTDVQPWAGGYYTFDARTYLKHTNVYEPARWGTWYMYDETGRCVSGYKYWQNGLYYFHPGTYLKATNETVWENGNAYWADGGGVVRTGNWQIEHAIDTGTSLVGHSPYVWGVVVIAGQSQPASLIVPRLFAGALLIQVSSLVMWGCGDLFTN